MFASLLAEVLMSWLVDWLPSWSVVLPWLAVTGAVICFIAGMLGCVLPYPGHAVLLAGCALWSYGRGAPDPAVWCWVVLVVLAILGSFADTLFALAGARKFGCSRAAFWGSAIGMIIGMFFFPIGLVAGPFVGAFVGEWLVERRSVKDSAISGTGALVGMLIGTGAKFVVAGIMLLLFFMS